MEVSCWNEPEIDHILVLLLSSLLILSSVQFSLFHCSILFFIL
jgi:hypothetical protein